MRKWRTDLIDLSPCLEVVALIMAAQQLESLAHMVPGILDLMDEWRHFVFKAKIIKYVRVF